MKVSLSKGGAKVAEASCADYTSSKETLPDPESCKKRVYAS
jgi:hypothetical protein